MAETVEESEEVEELEAEVSIEEEEPVVAVMAQPKQPVAEEKVEPVKPVVEAKQISFSLSGVPYEVPNDATKEIPSIREIMGRPLVAPVTEVVKINNKTNKINIERLKIFISHLHYASGHPDASHGASAGLFSLCTA